MKKISLLILSIFFISLASFSVSASAPYLGVFEQDTQVELIQTCILNNTFCDACNVTSLLFPNGTTAELGVAMTKRSGDFNFTLQNNFTQAIGQYYVNGLCTTGTDAMNTWVYFLDITPTGQLFDSGQGFVSLGILGGVLALMFFFFILGFKFSEDDNTKPLALLFIVISIFLALYSLQLGLNFSVDILQYDGITDMQRAIYLSILWLVSGIGIISFILMTFGFVREFGKGKMMHDYGEGFDPISQTYRSS